VANPLLVVGLTIIPVKNYKESPGILMKKHRITEIMKNI
jgi:hypothetical protein